jgi:hypothetical protein
MAETRRFAGLVTRSELRAANNLGVVYAGSALKQKFRRPELDIFDAYYEGRAYVGLTPWDQSQFSDGQYIPVRQRCPRIQYEFAKVLAARLASKLVGSRTFPLLKVEEDPDTETYLQTIKQAARLKAHLVEPVRRMIVAGSSFVRFYVVEGQFKVQCYLSKWCYPEFDGAGNLESIRIQYVYEDESDRDSKGKPKKKWFKLELGKAKDIKYDNPEFNGDTEPRFKVVETVDHDLGFVQGEWFKTSEKTNSIDGDSLIEPVLGFIDELNYSLSQSSTAVQYNQDPQLALTKMDEEDVDKLIRSSAKAWNLGKEGEASFIEAGMTGVEKAMELRDKVRMSIQDVTRIIMLDPEKIVGSAQSAKAMEVLHGPMVELIEELRPMLEKSITSLVLKMAAANIMIDDMGAPSPVQMPPGYKPVSMNVTVQWPEIFPMTMLDLQQKVAIVSSVTGANVISRETAMKWIAKDFGIENIEEELAKIAAQPVLNPFGGF